MRFRIEVEAALLRRAASARMSVALTRADGSSVKVAARNAASATKADAIVDTVGYLWDLFGDMAGVRQRDDVIDRIVRGAEVQVGGLRLTTIGIAWKRNPIVRWSTIGHPVVEGLKVTIPTEGEPIVVSIAAADAYMLPALVPALRRRFRFV